MFVKALRWCALMACLGIGLCGNLYLEGAGKIIFTETEGGAVDTLSSTDVLALKKLKWPVIAHKGRK